MKKHVKIFVLFISTLLFHFSSIANVLALSPVTIEGRLFKVNGVPYYPTAHFLNTGLTNQYTHTYLALSSTEQTAMINAVKNAGYNSMYIYTFNQGDYSSAPKYFISPYQNATTGDPWGNDQIDTTKLNTWYTAIQNIANAGIRPVIWLVADDSPAIRGASIDKLKGYVLAMKNKFDGLNPLWVVALEAQEDSFESKANDLGVYLNGLTSNPVGVHELSNQTGIMDNSWVQFGMYQYGFEYQDLASGWEGLYTETTTKRPLIGTKPFIASEYTHKLSNDNKKLGLAAAFGRAAGIGNGAPAKNSAGVRLDDFMESLGNLDNYTSSRSGNFLYLKSSTKTAVADMDTMDFYIQGGSTNTPTPSPTKTPTPTPTKTPTGTPTNTPTPTIILTYTPTSPPLRADANGDGFVNLLDYQIWRSNYLKSLSGTANGDFNNNGKVEGVDYVIWMKEYTG